MNKVEEFLIGEGVGYAEGNAINAIIDWNNTRSIDDLKRAHALIGALVKKHVPVTRTQVARMKAGGNSSDN